MRLPPAPTAPAPAAPVSFRSVALAGRMREMEDVVALRPAFCVLRWWAGPALGPLIYPASHASPLQELWARLVYVRADVDILRRRDYMTWRMGHVSYYCAGMTEETWPVSMYHVATELQLPEPVVLVRAKEDQGEEKEECPVCLEELESGLVKWPGCFQPHVFPGECLELSLKESEKCPICRRRLSAPVDDEC